MIRDNVKQRVKFSIVMVVIAMVVSFAIFTVMRYEVEGEKSVPFQLGKVIIISSAFVSDADSGEVSDFVIENTEISKDVIESGLNNENNSEGVSEITNNASNGETNANIVNDESDNTSAENSNIQNTENNEVSNTKGTTENENYIWNKRVVQTNDVYLYLDKNMDFKEEQIIRSVKIENIQILQNVNLGKVQVYMPTSLDGSLYKYTNEFLVNSTLTYTGATADNKKNLEIGNQGGCICVSFANMGLNNYKSNEDQEIEQGASILEKMSIADEDLKFKVSFDLIIEVQDKSYITNMVLDLPVENLVGQRETHKEITDFSDLIFKRL